MLPNHYQKLSKNKFFRVIRWTHENKYIIDKYPINEIDTSDPRKYKLQKFKHAKVYGLTSFSWLLPVELTADGLNIIKIHYDKIIEPSETYQEYGIEDARITKIAENYFIIASGELDLCCRITHISKSNFD